MAGEPGGAPDLVTQLQDSLAALARLFHQQIGAVQRGAPALPVGPRDPGDAGPPRQQLAAQSRQMAGEVVQACQAFEALVRQLPDVAASEQQQLDAIAALMAQNEAAGAAVEAELARAALRLEQVQGLYAALADDRLAHRAPAAG